MRFHLLCTLHLYYVSVVYLCLKDFFCHADDKFHRPSSDILSGTKIEIVRKVKIKILTNISDCNLISTSTMKLINEQQVTRKLNTKVDPYAVLAVFNKESNMSKPIDMINVIVVQFYISTDIANIIISSNQTVYLNHPSAFIIQHLY